MSKAKRSVWRISQNTDSVDIDQRCIGLSPRRDSIPADVWDYIATNRGLHVQIRHNEDPQTFAQANDLAHLIAASPDMLALLKRMLAENLEHGDHGDMLDRREMIDVIAKAEGRKSR